MKKEKESYLIKKPLKIAAWFGIIAILFGFLNGILPNLVGSTQVFSYYFSIATVLSLILSVFFLYGFYVLGKKYNNLLKIVSLILILFLIFSSFFSWIFVSPLLINVSEDLGKIVLDKTKIWGIDITNADNLTEEQSILFFQEVVDAVKENQELSGNLFLLVISFFSYLLVLFVFMILFGVGLIKIRKEVKYARLTGILQIIGVVTSIIFIGFFLLFAVAILEIVILFNESKKLKL